ncbi:MAG: GFA family protein [Thiobacillus sp.]|nr:GFA family protein [Thiobacillus sp.]
MRGNCLCGEVEFAVSGVLPNIYQCHCSLCRKATGSSANAALIVLSENFQWVCGQDRITSYVNDTGYRSDFCSKCGSPLPNPLGDRAEYWVPVGLLEDNASLQITAHLHVGSKASWDVVGSSGVQYQEAPNLESLLKVLRQNANT